MNKKLIMLLLTICLVATSAITVFANTGDTSNTSYKMTLTPSGQNDYDSTSWRIKNNSSAVYFKVNYVKYKSHDLTGWIQGKKGSLGLTKNCSGGHYYTINKVKTFKMTNYVRENGKDRARIYAGADPGDSNVIQGVWSPDSKR